MPRPRRHILGSVSCACACAFVICLVSACASPAAQTRTPPSTPSPSATSTSFPTVPPTQSVPMRAVTFVTVDHLRLVGTLYGRGTQAVIFSNQTDTTESDWRSLAQQFAAHGYLALTYSYRGHSGSQGRFDDAPHFPNDLQSAVTFVRTQGARRVVLLGASLGGAVTLRAAAIVLVDGVVTLSAPANFLYMEVSDELLKKLTLPKLFVNSEADDFTDDTRHMYEVATPPKDLLLYPNSSAHGIEMLSAPYGGELLQRLFAFADAHTAHGAI